MSPRIKELVLRVQQEDEAGFLCPSVPMAKNLLEPGIF